MGSQKSKVKPASPERKRGESQKFGNLIIRNILVFARPHHGFTLIETVTSLGILMLGVAASLTLMVSMLAYSRQTESMIVVVNLAREGIEMVRGIRDTDGFPLLPAGNWIVDSNTISLTTAASLNGMSDIQYCTNCALNLNGGRYLHTAGNTTPYTRFVRIINISSSEKQISSFVGWTEHGRSHVYTLNTVLTDWQ